ncbi:MAG TPA: DegT/DnrJ/EryC1/StrS family aminotransferase [Gryllotalpicola sp.]
MTESDSGVPFLDLVSQQAEVADEVLPVWQRLFTTAQFVGGPEIAQFEREYAAYLGVEHCVAVGNGTDALELSYRALGIGPGDEVIVPVNTFIATAETVTSIGATPVFVDVDEDQLLIDPAAVEAAITPRTRAIAAVHLFGQTAPIDALRPIAERHGVALVEDAAQSQGASSSLGRAGALGTITATSFYPGKNLGAAGDAGAVLTNDAALADFVRNYAGHGSSVKYVHDRPGGNSRMDAIHAVILSAKLGRLDEWNRARAAAADRYAELLAEVPGIRTPASRAGNEDVWHLYVVRLAERDRVLGELHAVGIGAAIHYPTPLHLTDAYAGLGYQKGRFPVAEAAAERILSLPMFPHLTVDQQEHVVAALKAAASVDALG